MDDSQIQDAKKKLTAINKIITSLDPAIRAAAFEVLEPLFFDEAPATRKTDGGKNPKRAPRTASTDDAGKFFNSFEHDKPSENVHLIVAWFYSQYGVFPVGTKELREMAGSVGLTVPARPDATMRVAKVKGKKLYQKKATGYQPTVHGESHLKETYSVKKGTKPRPVEDDE